MGYRTIKLILLSATALLSACGGGGGGSSAVNQQPNLIVAGQWAGTYDIGAELRGITASLQSSGATVSGTFLSDSNMQGTVSGSIAGNNIHLTLSSTAAACPGSYSANGIISGDAINFIYSGSDCAGTYSNKEGKLNKLPATGSIGWSGNWWAVAGTGHYTLVSLTSLDSVNYSGKLTMVNKADRSELTADLSGIYGWRNIAPPQSSSPGYTWMPMQFSNIQGKLYANQPPLISGALNIPDYSGSSLRISPFDFAEQGGSTTLSGAWFNKTQ